MTQQYVGDQQALRSSWCLESDSESDYSRANDDSRIEIVDSFEVVEVAEPAVGSNGCYRVDMVK